MILIYKHLKTQLRKKGKEKESKRQSSNQSKKTSCENSAKLWKMRIYEWMRTMEEKKNKNKKLVGWVQICVQ